MRPPRASRSREATAVASPDEARRLARASALRMLARRPRTAAEIAAALVRRGLDEPVVGDVVEELRRSRLVDDAAVADAVVREAERRRRGSRRVAHELQRRGVPAELRAAAVAASAAGEADAARRVLAQRFPAGVPRDRRGLARALRMLVGRGFSTDATRRALGIDVDVDEIGEE